MKPTVCRCCGGLIDHHLKGRWSNVNTCHECDNLPIPPDAAASESPQHTGPGCPTGTHNRLGPVFKDGEQVDWENAGFAYSDADPGL